MIGAQGCNTTDDCTQAEDVCYSLTYNEPTDDCPDENCICVQLGNEPGSKGHFEKCFMQQDCRDGDCVNAHRMMAEDRCTGECTCIPCYQPRWVAMGCQRFEVTKSSCRGALLVNVSEVCGDSCRVVLPDWVS